MPAAPSPSKTTTGTASADFLRATGCVTLTGPAVAAGTESAAGGDVSGTVPNEGGGTERVDPVTTERNASANSLADPNRCSGSRASARAMNASKPGGTRATDDGAGTGSVQIFTSKSPSTGLSNGRRPVMHSKAITPSAHRSAR